MLGHSRIEKITEEVRAFFQEYPFCAIDPVNVPEKYLVKKKRLMSSPELSAAIKDLMSSGELAQPRAGTLAYNGAEYVEHLQSNGFRPFNMLKDGKPTVYLEVGDEVCEHEWHLKHEGDTFILACSNCQEKIKAWKRFPSMLSKLLDTTVRLMEQVEASTSKLKASDVRDAAKSVYLRPGLNRCAQRCAKRHAWDTYAALMTILNVKAGRAPGSPVIRSKVLKTLVRVCVYPDELKSMARSSSHPYKFVVEAIKQLDIQLS
jgi:hypothetical protein